MPVLLLLGLACTEATSPEEASAWATPVGDPERGRHALLNEPYVECGIPSSVYDEFVGPAPASYRIGDRDGRNAELPYYATAHTTPSGVEVIANNCLYCHGSQFDGDIVIGLGNPWLDFTVDASAYAAMVPALTSTDAELEEAERWSERITATAPSIVTGVVGANPADTLAQSLFAHRDPDTLAWSSEPLLDLPPPPWPTDVPPLWNMRKKTAMLYTGSAQGNLARIMMTASALCTDDTESADAIYSYFPDILAYFAATEPPVFPGAVDADAAAAGVTIFAERCASCHGTYGEEWTYENLVIPTDEVGTDSALSEHLDEDGDAVPYGEWFNASWYGQDARMAPTGGYVAPPLDGIWATAPYLHNGSVPTLAALLDSSLRPTAFVRSRTYDLDAAIGWAWTAPDEDSEAAEIYETTVAGYGAGGHTYGDALTDEERASLLAYLLTL